MVTDPTPDDCKGMACDGMGNAVEVDLPVGATCMGTKVCNATGTCVTCTDMNLGCAMGKTCYMEQECVSCSDGMQNGGETGVDCGGTCGKCNGETCANAGECKLNFCADGVCCNVACDATALCRSCNLPGKAGTCSVVINGMTDPDTCTNGNACDGTTGGGACKSVGTKKLLGEVCADNNSCFNTRCVAGNFCGLSKNDPCSDNYTCATKQCTNNVCTECMNDAQCASGVCETGTKACKIPLGEPCTISGGIPGCIAGTCKGKLCKLNDGDTCMKNTDCLGFCNAMMKCAPCAGNTDCGNGGMCNNGVCLAPAGAICSDGTQCASGMCTGFPPKCQ